MTPRRKAAAKPAAAKPAVAAHERAGQAPDDAAVSALLDQLTDCVSALPEALEQGEKARRMRAEATRELLASPEFKRMSQQSPEVREKITSVGQEEDRKDAAAQQSIAELSDASKEWLEALMSLRDLGA
jgi:hypothetical protein